MDFKSTKGNFGAFPIEVDVGRHPPACPYIKHAYEDFSFLFYIWSFHKELKT